MFEELDKIDGDLDVVRDTRLYGLVTGNVTVKPGKTLIVHGMIGGNLLLEAGSVAHLYGTVFGDVVNRGRELRVWSTATIRGVLDRAAVTRVEPGAKVRGFTPLGTCIPTIPPPSAPIDDPSGVDRAELCSDSPPSVIGCGELSGFRVLVVEDDDATRDEVVALLQLCDAEAIAASNGSEAYEAFVRERPDAILADLWMPKVDGYDLIKRVRALSFEEGGLTPAIAMTASSSDPQEKALRAGFHAHFDKPFDPLRFIDLLRSFHDTRRAGGPDEAAPRWTVTKPRDGWIVLTFSERIRAADMRSGLAAVALRLGQGPATLVVDARRITGFDVSVGSIAERSLWEHRSELQRVVVVSPDRSVHLVAASTCVVLGVACDAADELPPEAVPSDQN